MDSIQETYVAEDDILKRAVYNPNGIERIFMTVLENGKINLYVHNEIEPVLGAAYNANRDIQFFHSIHSFCHIRVGLPATPIVGVKTFKGIIDPGQD